MRDIKTSEDLPSLDLGGYCYDAPHLWSTTLDPVGAAQCMKCGDSVIVGRSVTGFTKTGLLRGWICMMPVRRRPRARCRGRIKLVKHSKAALSVYLLQGEDAFVEFMRK